MRSIKILLALIVAYLLSAITTPADATILFAGGEDIDFTFIGDVNVSTNSTNFRSAYTREAIQGAASLLPLDPPTNRFLTSTFTNTTSLWLHAESQALTANTFLAAQAFAAYGSDGVRRLMIVGTGTNGVVKISKRNSAGSFTDLVTCTPGGWPISTILTKLDWFINYAVSGHTTLYANGVQICDYSGDVTTDGITSLSQFDISQPANGSGENWISEVIVSTTDTRDMNLFTCYPASNGTNMTWTGSFANVNPTVINDPSNITTASNNAIAEFTCPALPSGSFTVPAVTSALRLQIGATGPQNFQFVTRPATGATDFFSGSAAGTNVFGNHFQIQGVNPATSSPWTQADVNLLQQGIKSIP